MKITIKCECGNILEDFDTSKAYDFCYNCYNDKFRIKCNIDNNTYIECKVCDKINILD